ncbi:hypothetical protein DI09_74p120 [Mitosporidium daphniae]|uniref:Rho-GAP domain-containing protein n=1 Tax=Mitosporidium daphniae TaxID=1485682 RepID=A0A098VN78_9MICR|nr:uncharacterized protein DI09_74p120 [Mitosporidium daphniae]KGG50370.1 hypothetical protein DI09_74p120 [Mitosporidium daphniae]|eukprot:XP_013236797.1 uncharacterized protein DI09_74p120 [Mitosporidium daphniae]
MSVLLSRYQHLRDDGKCTSIFDSYKAIIELRKKFLEEFNVVILKLFRVDLLEQATQINIIMLDLNNSEAEFNERRDCVSKKDLRIQMGSFGKRRAAQIALLAKANQVRLIQLNEKLLSEFGKSRSQLLKAAFQYLGLRESFNHHQLVENQFSFVDALFKVCGGLINFKLLTSSSTSSTGDLGEFSLDSDKCRPKSTIPEMVTIEHPVAGQLKSSILETQSPPILAGIVLKFFSDLPEPLFPFITHPELDAIAYRREEDIRLGLITKTINNLPMEHGVTLSKFIGHIYQFWNGEEPSGDDLSKISRIAGKVIIRKNDTKLGAISTGIGKDMSMEQVITKDLIANFPLLFGAFCKK